MEEDPKACDEALTDAVAHRRLLLAVIKLHKILRGSASNMSDDERFAEAQTFCPGYDFDSTQYWETVTEMVDAKHAQEEKILAEFTSALLDLRKIDLLSQMTFLARPRERPPRSTLHYGIAFMQASSSESE